MDGVSAVREKQRAAGPCCPAGTGGMAPGLLASQKSLWKGPQRSRHSGCPTGTFIEFGFHDLTAQSIHKTDIYLFEV